MTELCGGGALVTGLMYRHEAAYVRVVGQQDCGDGTPCPVYRFEPMVFYRQDADPCWPDLPDPGVDEVLLERITAIDEAGNEDCGL